MNIYEKLSAIQGELNAPKSLYNSYGGFAYRSCEGILEAVKPICKKYNTVLTLSDLMVEIAGRFYVQATAHLIDLDEATLRYIEVTAYAREEDAKKGMDGSQVTGASSSYARKYALNGLFCIDDAKDSDFTNNGQTNGQNTAQSAPQRTEQPKREKAQAKPQTATRTQPDAESEVCNSCGRPISDKVRDYSVKKFGVPLCMDCQKDYAR